MKRLITVLLVFMSLVSCEGPQKEKIFHTTKMELRQLVNSVETSKSTQGSFFFVVASVSSSENSTDIIKMFAKIDNKSYKMLVFDLSDVEIVIDNSITKPYVQIEYEDYDKQTDKQTIRSVGYGDVIRIHCSEKYLPEKLIPIKL